MFAVYQSVMKHDIQAHLKTNRDTRFSTTLSFRLEKGKIANPEFEWEEANEEFTYRGELYDIITLQYSTDSVQIWALKDIRENTIHRTFVYRITSTMSRFACSDTPVVIHNFQKFRNSVLAS